MGHSRGAFRFAGLVAAAFTAVTLTAGPVLSAADAGKDATVTASEAPRPAALVPLYVSFAALQALDVDSTLRAVSTGSREANPVAGAVVGSPGGFIAMKAAAAAAITVATERLRKRHPRAAVLLMIGLDSAYAAVVAHNYSAAAPRR